MSIVVTAVFHPRDTFREDLIEALRAAIPAIHDEDGCLLYAIHDADDGTITMIEKWTTAQALDAHASGSAVAALNALVTPFLASATRVTTMTALPAGSTELGRL